jgi:hypothetical protein
MVPLVRTPESQPSLTGDEALSDLLRILFSGDITVGVHALDPDPNHAFPDYVTNFVTTSNAAVTLQEDLVDQAYTKVFTAVAGELEIFELVSSHQTRGVVRHVELREMAPNPDTEALEPVEGGPCYWIEEAEYDVRRANGCTPYTDDACPEDSSACRPTRSAPTASASPAGRSSRARPASAPTRSCGTPTASSACAASTPATAPRA